MFADFDECQMGHEQAQHAQQVEALWASYGPLLREQHDLRGGMIWKKARGHEYLYRYLQDPETGTKRFDGQGRRSPETEATYAAYFARREKVQIRLDDLTRGVDVTGRMARAYKMARFPATAARIIHGLWLEGLMDERLSMMGATALLGYEIAARFVTPPSLVRGESLRILVRDKIDDRLAGVAVRLAQGADGDFSVMERDEDNLVLDGGRGGRIEFHTTSSLLSYLMARELDSDLLTQVLMAVTMPAWHGVVVARDAQLTPVTSIDPRAHALLTYGTALTEPDEDRAELLTKRARLMAWVAEERLGLAFTPAQVNAFPDLWEGDVDREDQRRWGVI